MDENIPFPMPKAVLRSDGQARNETISLEDAGGRSFESTSRTNKSEEVGVEPLSSEQQPEDKFTTKLPDEMILRVLRWVPRNELGVVANVNRRLNRLTKDETLWKRVDAFRCTLSNNHLNDILSRSPIYARFACADMLKLQVRVTQSCHQLTHLDLSWATVHPVSLGQLFFKAPNITHLSLEGLDVNYMVINAMKTFAKSVIILDVAFARGIPAKTFKKFLLKPSNLQELNMRDIKQNWDRDDLLAVFKSLSASLEKLDIAKFGNQLNYSHIKIVAQKCKLLKHLNVMECFKLTAKSLQHIVSGLPNLQYLGLFGCFGVKPDTAYQRLQGAKNLRFLEVYYFSDDFSRALQAMLPVVQIYFGSISICTVASPTTSGRVDRAFIWNQRVRD